MTTSLNGFLALLSNHTIFSLSAHSLILQEVYVTSPPLSSNLQYLRPFTWNKLLTLLISCFIDTKNIKALWRNILIFPPPHLQIYLCLFFSALISLLLALLPPPVHWIPFLQLLKDFHTIVIPFSPASSDLSLSLSLIIPHFRKFYLTPHTHLTPSSLLPL